MWDWIDSIRHRPEPAHLDIDLGSFVPTSARARLYRHRPVLVRHGPAWHDINLGPLGSTSVWARSTSYQPWLARLDIGSSLLNSTSIWACMARYVLACSSRYRPGPARPDIGPKRLSSTRAWTSSTQHRLKVTLLDISSTRLKMGSSRLGSVFDMGRLDSIWAQTNSSHH